jgi:outer membrane protein OmpA-like peptidoglycan-associated protein
MMPSNKMEIANNPNDQALVMNVDLSFAEQTNSVSPADVPLFDSIATVLIQRKDLALKILNHSTEGSDQNEQHRRANAVRDLLIRRGVPPARVQSYSGKTSAVNPVVRQSDPNRTTFVFTKL